MKNYRINCNTDTNPGGHNEVHSQDCTHYSILNNYEDLGLHADCHSAIRAAKSKGYHRADGCATCCTACHTG